MRAGAVAPTDEPGDSVTGCTGERRLQVIMDVLGIYCATPALLSVALMAVIIGKRRLRLSVEAYLVRGDDAFGTIGGAGGHRTASPWLRGRISHLGSWDTRTGGAAQDRQRLVEGRFQKTLLLTGSYLGGAHWGFVDMVSAWRSAPARLWCACPARGGLLQLHDPCALAFWKLSMQVPRQGSTQQPRPYSECRRPPVIVHRIYGRSDIL